MRRVKRNIDRNIRRHVKEEWLNYTKNNYSKRSSLRNALSVFYLYREEKRQKLSCHAVEKLCIGCIYAMLESEGGKDLCAFCRTPPTLSNEESIIRLKKLMAKGVGGAFFLLAGYYDRGMMGLTQDWAKSNELLLRGGELGYSEAYYNLGVAYDQGMGVEVDKNKAKYYYELAAMNGSIKARHNLGCIEVRDGNDHRAYRYYMIAAKGGHEKSLAAVKMGFKKGLVTKEYANVLRAYHERQKEIKSEERDKAEAFYRALALNRGR